MNNIHEKVVRITSQNIMIDWLEPYKNKFTTSSVGSGFFIDNKGTILTCSHLVINSKKVYVEIPQEGKKKYTADIISTCPDFDIAVLKIKGYRNKSFFNLLEKDKFYNLKLGKEIFALGFPLGQDNLKITQGIISGRDSGLIQTSAGLNKGNSGGPMLLDNIVIGINVSKISNANNIGYAVPLLYYYNIMHVKTKLIKRPILGIHYLNLDKNYNELNNIKCDNGILIKNVHKNSPLWNCGLRKGHILCSLGGHNIDNYGLLDKKWFDEKMTINDIKKTFKLNDKIVITYYNKKKLIKTHFKFTDFDLTITKKYPMYDSSGEDYEVFAGMVVCDMNIDHIKTLVNDECDGKFNLNYHTSRIVNLYKEREEERLIITHLFPNTIIKKLENIRVGDIIEFVNNKKVKNIKDYRKALSSPIIKNKKKYLKLITEDGKECVLSLNEVMKEEKENSVINKYSLSNSYKNLKSNKSHKKKNKNKKHTKKK